MNPACEQSALASIEQAIDALTQLLERPLATESLPIEQATGRILANDVFAQLDTPRWNNSAMDGYALNSADLAQCSRLPVAGCQAAGDLLKTLPAGHCMQIFTGAPVPPEADTVIPLENCHRYGGEVEFGQVKAGQNIRLQGEETRAGQRLLARGTRLRAQEIGLLASQGHARTHVFRPLRVGLISSGNELCVPGSPLAQSQIYDTNRYLLSSLLQGWGFAVTRYPILRDSLADSLMLLEQAATEQDVLISSGGVSVGEADYLKAAVEQLGQLNLWRVAIQPGKPLALGKIGKAVWIGLPGNPAASLVTALMIVRPALLCTQGLSRSAPVALPVHAAFRSDKPRVRTQYLQARLEIIQGTLHAQLHPQQSSAMLANCCWADGLAVIPARQGIEPGDMLDFISYQELL